MSKRKQKQIILTPGWAIYLRTSSKDTQNPKNSQERQRQAIYANVISKNSMPVYAEYADTETGLNPHRTNYQKMLHDARLGKFSHIVAENTERFGRNDTESLRAMDEMATLGVQVRFADYPDLDPMDSDERIVIVLTAALARRESDKISERTIGGLQTSARTGGYIGRAPDGYINREKTVSVHQSDNQGRRVTWIEPDPKQAQVWREAWQLLLENRYTLREICEILHQRGHTFKTGRPFVKSAPKGKRTHATNDLSRIFRNPVYAGWVNNLEYVKPMTVDGNWEAIIDRQDFLRGLEILECRSRKRHTKRKHFYLLLRIAYVQTEGHITRLSGSTPNVNRTTKGNPYYCLPSSNINIPCTIVDNNVRQLLATLNIEKALQAQLRSIFREEIRQTLAYSTNDVTRLKNALAHIDQEEERAFRVYATGKVSDEIWAKLHQEWQERRHNIQQQLSTLQTEEQHVIDDIEQAMAVISQVDAIYDKLSPDEQQQLLGLIFKQVVVDSDGNIVRLVFHPPFGYIIKKRNEILAQQAAEQSITNKSATLNSGASESLVCSKLDLEGVGFATQLEPSIQKPLDILRAFPQKQKLRQLLF